MDYILLYVIMCYCIY